MSNLTPLLVTNTEDQGIGSLRDAILQANNNPGEDVITFDSTLVGETIVLNSGQLVVEDDLIIIGLGETELTVSGGGNSRIFLLESTSADPKSLTITDLTLTEGFATPTDNNPDVSRGGAIATEHQGELTVENVTFSANQADDGGGAIYSAFEGTLTVIDSQFLQNIATAGNDERGAGAIAFHGPGQLTIDNTDFIGNQGINGAAINNLNGRVNINKSRFLNNDVLAATVDEGEPRPTLRGYGGAIFADRASAANDEEGGTIRITNTEFTGNQGRSAGGAVYVFTGGSDRLEVINSSFRENQAVGLPGGEGGNSGAIELQSNQVNRGFVVVNSEFIGNRAVDRGGASRTRNAPTTIVNSTFADNRTTIAPTESFTGGVGGALELGGGVEAVITNATFSQNFATWVGGAIGGNAEITVNNSIFYENWAENGTNDWNIQQQAVNGLSGSNNLQFPGEGGAVTPNIQVADPLLGELTTVGILPLADTPVIDAGDNSLIPPDSFDLDGDGDVEEAIPFDGRGLDRVVNDAVDLGAIELQNNSDNESDPFPWFGSLGDDQVQVSESYALVFAGEGQDQVETLSTSSQSHRLYGGSDADQLRLGMQDIAFGGAGNDLLDASSGNGGNRLYGGEGNDELRAGSNDILIGGAGRDRFFVGTGGNNRFTGNAGEDEFWLVNGEVPEQGNLITDFTPGEDILQMSGFGDLTFDQLSITDADGDTIIGLNPETPLIRLLGIAVNVISADNLNTGA